LERETHSIPLPATTPRRIAISRQVLFVSSRDADEWKGSLDAGGVINAWQRASQPRTSEKPLGENHVPPATIHGK